MKKTKKELRLEEVMASKFEQLKVFCKMCHYAKTNAAFGGNGITKADLIKKGISEELFQWLVKEHYCNEQKPGKPLWVAVNGNKFYPEQTVQNLEKSIKEFEKENLSKN